MTIESLAETLRKEVLEKGALPLETRKQRLEGLRQAIKANERKLTEALAQDLGKSSFEAYATEIGFILDEIRFIQKHLDAWASVRKVKTPLTLFPGKSFIHPEPYGLVLIISPWNYPFQLCLSPFLGALAAGNRAVIKPSEFAPKTAAAIRTLIEDVMRPSEARVVEGGVRETQELLAQKFDYIFFTGSTSIGKLVMKAAAENLTPVTLELGGKSPCLIEESANLDLAAKRCAWGKFLNAGQTCVAPDYVLVPKKRQDEFVGLMKNHLVKFFGETPEASQDYSRIISRAHVDRLRSLVETQKIAFGGDSNREERFFAPTILRDVGWDDRVMSEEIFGPILPVIPYEELTDVLTRVLARPKPLAFYLFTQDEEKRKHILERVPFGGGCVNDTVVHLANPHLPFGGVGPSGIGNYHGKRSFDTFTHSKSVYAQRANVDIPLRYPPFEGKLKWLKLFIR